MSALVEPIHPAAKICPIEHDPDRNLRQKAVLDAAITFFLIDARCQVFFGGENMSGKYEDPHAKTRELEALIESSRDRLMTSVAQLLKVARPPRARSRKRARHA